MTFVFDTSALIALKPFTRGPFRALWTALDRLTATGSVVSVREVKNELDRWNDADAIQDWAEKNAGLFAPPSGLELSFVKEILSIPHFQALISAKAMLTGRPVADPFVIASAAIRKGTVVTEERIKPHAAKIPNVCKHFKIPCIDLESFMSDQKWTFELHE